MPIKVVNSTTKATKLASSKNAPKTDQKSKNKRDLIRTPPLASPTLTTKQKPVEKSEHEEGLKSADVKKHVKRELLQNKHELLKKKGPVGERRKQCEGCIMLYKKSHGTEYAMKFAKKVATYCKLCPNEPHLCADCFKIDHEVDTIELID